MTPLSSAELDLLRSARRAVLATLSGTGHPRLVPIAFALDGGAATPVLYSALDEKPKSVADPRALARVRDIVERPSVSVLVDRWSEEWSELAWVRLFGTARVLEPDLAALAEHGRAVALLRARYPQYATHALERLPIIRIEVESATSWFAAP